VDPVPWLRTKVTAVRFGPRRPRGRRRCRRGLISHANRARLSGPQPQCDPAIRTLSYGVARRSDTLH
jgi:hypothetical protein